MASETPGIIFKFDARYRHKGFVIPLNVVEFFCTDGMGKWLLHRRGPACADEVGRWDFGGGKLEHGESRFECLRREMREEYGPELRCYTTRQLPGYTMFRDLPGGNRQHLEVTPFVCPIDRDTVDMSEMIHTGKMTGFRWFEIIKADDPGPSTAMIPELPNDELHSAIPFVLERYAAEFVSPSISPSTWLLLEHNPNLIKRKLAAINAFDMKETINTRAHVVNVVPETVP